jgi:hypothetical protein
MKGNAKVRFSTEVTLHGLLPIHEIVERFIAGAIPVDLFVRAFRGRLAQDAADMCDDDDPLRQYLLSVSDEAWDWFEARHQSVVPQVASRQG